MGALASAILGSTWQWRWFGYGMARVCLLVVCCCGRDMAVADAIAVVLAGKLAWLSK